MCPPSPETIPDKQPAPGPPIINDQPLFFTSPENLSPLGTEPVADDDKCPTRLMKISKIPVCDSGNRGQDLMRLSGEETYTIFNIRLCMSLPIVYPELLTFDRLWAACCHSVDGTLYLQIPTRIRVCGRVNRGVALQPDVR